MLPVEVIALKRNKKELSSDQIENFISDFTQNKIPDYQMSAFLMAILLNGMSGQETLSLTKSMMNSGTVLDWKNLNLPTVDKHSTGGIGDKTSLILGPIVASLGVGIPMIAGRGLGHTGGTADKLEAIPGFTSEISLESFKKNVSQLGLSIIAQTKNICPADKKIYALRDVTATVESIPLICASIMSKKLAEGTDALVLDVKYGSGAFMQNKKEALELAKKLKAIGLGAKRRVTAFITDMNQTLGQWVGNSVEIEECVNILKNNDPQNLYADTRELSLILSAEMLALTKRAKNFKDGYSLAQKTLLSGKAFEKFDEFVQAQGGDLRKLPKPSIVREIHASKAGFVKSFNAKEIGYASIEMGAGRRLTSDKINPVSGIRVHKKIGDRIQKGEPLFTLVGSSEYGFDLAQKRLLSSVQFSSGKVRSQKLIYKKI